MQSGATVVGLVGTGLGLLGKVSQLDQCQAVTQSRVESSEVKAEKSEAKVKHRFEKLEQKIDALDSKLQKKVDKLEQEIDKLTMSMVSYSQNCPQQQSPQQQGLQTSAPPYVSA